MNIIFMAVIFCSLVNPVAFAESVLCRNHFDEKLNALVFSNRDLNSTIGEALPETCLYYFLAYSQNDSLPSLNQKLLSAILDIHIPQADELNDVELIASTAPRAKTQLEIHFYLDPGPDGMNDINAILSQK
jgi:hypothetical protein